MPASTDEKNIAGFLFIQSSFVAALKALAGRMFDTLLYISVMLYFDDFCVSIP